MKFGDVSVARGGRRRVARPHRRLPPVDLSDAGPTAGGAGAVGERFAEQASSIPSRSRSKFYATHPDNYDQLVIWTDTAVIQRRVRLRDDGRQRDPRHRHRTSTTRRATSAAPAGCAAWSVMDWLGKYPDDPTQKFLGENNTLSVLGQEVGHRWLAFLEFRDHTGSAFGGAARARPGALELLLRLRRVGDGRQRHRGSRRRIVPDDRRGAAIQPARSVRDGARSASRTCRRSSTSRARSTSCRTGPRRIAPRVGVTFNGTRRDVLIDDVIAIEGPRIPARRGCAERPPPGIHLPGRRPGRSPDNGADRQGRSDSHGVGDVLPAGHRGPDASRYDIAVSDRRSVRLQADLNRSG